MPKGLSSSLCQHIQICGNYSIMYVPSNGKDPLGKTNLPHPPNKRKLKAFQKAEGNLSNAVQS